MSQKKKYTHFDACAPFDISDDDVIKAMKGLKGYLDITPADFKELYHHAYEQGIERVSKLFNAEDVMTREVFFVKKDTSTEDVAHIMAEKGISGVPVVDNDGNVVGIISKSDFLFQMGSKDTKSFMEVIAHCLRNKGCTALSVRKQKAEDIMTSPVVNVRPEVPVSDMAAIMKEEKINRLPVVDEKGKLIGIVSRDDIVQASCALATKTEER